MTTLTCRRLLRCGCGGVVVWISEAIERWLTEHDTSPLTGARLETAMVFKNYALAATIAELRSQNEALRRKRREEEEEEEGKRQQQQQAGMVVVEEEEGESKADSVNKTTTRPAPADHHKDEEGEEEEGTTTGE